MIKLTRESHGLCSCTNLPACWQMSSTWLGAALGAAMLFGIIIGMWMVVLVMMW